MLRPRATIVSFLIASVMISPSVGSRVAAQDGSKSQAEDINLQFVHFEEALASKNAASVGEFYSAEALSLLQNQSPRRGREAIQARWKAVLAGPISFALTSQDINVSPCGQDAYQFAIFEIRSADSAASVLASGKLLFIWRKESERWRIALEMDNFNSPKAQGPPRL